MPYTAEITRTNPTCFVFLVDQSSSILEPLGGQATKQKAEGVADAIYRQDDNVLLFNAHVSVTQALAIEFPAVEDHLPDNFAKLLFRMSSTLPPQLFEPARADKFPVQAGARGFVFNADLVSVIRFLDIGTRVAQGVR